VYVKCIGYEIKSSHVLEVFDLSKGTSCKICC